MSDEKKSKEVETKEIVSETTPVETAPAVSKEEAPKLKKKVTISPQFIMIKKTDEKGNTIEGQPEYALMSNKTIEEPSKKNGKKKGESQESTVTSNEVQTDENRTKVTTPVPVVVKRKKRSYIACLCIGLVLLIAGVAVAAAGYPLAEVLSKQIKEMGNWAAVIFIVPLLYWCIIVVICEAPMFICFGFALPLLFTAKNSDRKSVKVWAIILLIFNILLMCAGLAYSIFLFVM